MPSRTELARKLVSVCHRLYQNRFVTATDGNVSVRLPNGNILATPPGLNKGRVTESDLVEVRSDGTPVKPDRPASSEIGMHLFIYAERSDVGAVVHAHPTYATGFATAHVPLTEHLLPEVVVGLGVIPLASYATPSTKEVAESIAPFVRTANAVLLANHGVVTYGKDLEDAYYKMEKVEHAAHITFIARVLGGEKALPPAAVEKLQALKEKARNKEAGLGRPRVGKQAGEPDDEEIKRLIREVLQERVPRQTRT